LEVNYGYEFATWASLRELDASLNDIHAARNLRSAQVQARHPHPSLNLGRYVPESLAQFAHPLATVQALRRGQSVQGRYGYSLHTADAKLGPKSLVPLRKPFD